MRLKTITLLLVAGLAMTLGACGTSGTSGGGEGTAPAPSPAASPSP